MDHLVLCVYRTMRIIIVPPPGHCQFYTFMIIIFYFILFVINQQSARRHSHHRDCYTLGTSSYLYDCFRRRRRRTTAHNIMMYKSYFPRERENHFLRCHFQMDFIETRFRLGRAHCVACLLCHHYHHYDSHK